MRTATRTFAALAVLLVGAGCSVKPLPEDLARCQDVDPPLAESLSRSITKADTVTRSFQQVVAEGGAVFVSAEMIRADDGPDDRGDIATWLVKAPGAQPVGADDFASRHSSTTSAYPEERFVETDGYLESRNCVSQKRPKNFLEKLG